MSETTIAGKAKWLENENLQRLIAVLSQEGEEARIAGGAVRNALLGAEVSDIDIATTTTPDETERLAQNAGFRTVPTGKEHGTITVIADGVAHEVTTLRADVATDGRHATVVFGKDWKADAARRDFTINGLYATASGQVIDLVGGIADLKARRLRFIGDASARIREDYLRILRFFRFFAWYGEGRPDADGLRACARLKEGMVRLSAERVWAELLKLLSAPDPARALLWMRQTGVLTVILPESEKWGIDSIHALIETERNFGWSADPLLRLEAIVPPDAARMAAMAARLKLSKAESGRLQAWAMTDPVSPFTSEAAMAKTAYRGDRKALEDRLRLALAAARNRVGESSEGPSEGSPGEQGTNVGSKVSGQALTRSGAFGERPAGGVTEMRRGMEASALTELGNYVRLLHFLENWKKPAFPLNGADLAGLGVGAGPGMGQMLAALEAEWVDDGFTAGREALLQRAAAMIAEA